MHALDGGGLMLAFGAFGTLDDESEAERTAIGRLVHDACLAQGLRPVWNGYASQRIALPDLRWQCRPRKSNRPPPRSSKPVDVASPGGGVSSRECREIPG